MKRRENSYLSYHPESSFYLFRCTLAGRLGLDTIFVEEVGVTLDVQLAQVLQVLDLLFCRCDPSNLLFLGFSCLSPAFPHGFRDFIQLFNLLSQVSELPTLLAEEDIVTFFIFDFSRRNCFTGPFLSGILISSVSFSLTHFKSMYAKT